MKLTTFIGIGEPRADTTWLYNVVFKHPEVWLPPLKELHYFDVKDSSVDRFFSYKDIF